MRTHTVGADLAAALTLCCTIAAQTDRSLPWPSASLQGTFSSATSGDFTGDQRRSCVVVRDGEPHFVFDPAIYTAISKVPGFSGVTSVERFPADPGHLPKRDRFLLSHAAGATLCTLQPDNTYSQVPVFGAGWADTENLDVRRDLIGNIAVAGLAGDGLSLRIANGPASGPWASVTGVAVPEPLADVVLVDWDQDAVTDVVGIGASTLYVFHLDGTPLPPIATGSTILAAAVWTGTGVFARLAVVHEAAGQALLVLRDHQTIDAAVALSDVGLGAPVGTKFDSITSADLNGDGEQDLALTHAGTAKLLVLGAYEALGSAPFTNYQTQQIVTTPAVNQLVGYVPRPVPDDFDRDGQADLVLLHEQPPTLYVQFEIPVAGRQAASTVQPLEYARIGNETGTLTLGLNPQFASGFEAIQVTVWHQLDPLPTATPLVAEALLNVLATPVTFLRGNTPVTELSVSGLELCKLTVWPDHDHLWIELRGVHDDVVAPSVVAGMTVQGFVGENSSDYMEYLASLPGTTLPPKPVNEYYRPQSIGGIVTRKDLPPIGDDLPITGG